MFPNENTAARALESTSNVNPADAFNFTDPLTGVETCVRI